MNHPAGAAPVEFASERLLLRSLRESDLDLYCELFCDSETMRYVGPPWTRAAASRVFRDALAATRCTPPRAVFLTLIRKDSLQRVGLCTLQNFDRARRRAELGLMLMPSGRAHNVATEALIAVLAHTFATLSLDEVWVRFTVDHAAAERTALGGGLVRQATASAADLAANLWRWSAYRGSWRPERT